MQHIEPEVDAPPELVREVPTELPTYRDPHIAAASADLHEEADVVLDVERAHCTRADPGRGPAAIDGGERESDPDHERRREEYFDRCEPPIHSVYSGVSRSVSAGKTI